MCLYRSGAFLAGLSVMCGVLLVGASAYGEEPGAPRSSAQGASKEKAKKVYTNEDLKNLNETTRVNQGSVSVTPDRASKKSGSIEGYRDAQGHDREYWQKKLRPLNSQLETLDSQIATQQAKYDSMNAASGVKLSRSGKLRTSSADTRTQVAKRIEELKQKRSEVLKSKQDLEEEARKAQALPEWLR